MNYKVIFIMAYFFSTMASVQAGAGNAHMLFSQENKSMGTKISLHLMCSGKLNFAGVVITIVDSKGMHSAKGVSDRNGNVIINYPEKTVSSNVLKIKILDWSESISSDDGILNVNLPEGICARIQKQKRAVTPKR